MSRRANVYVGLVIAVGLAILLQVFRNWNIDNWPRYLTYCALAMFASGLKVSLPGVTGTMSINFLFVLLGVSEIGLSGTVVMGCLGMLTQCLVFTKARPRPIHAAFSTASMACSVEASFWAYQISVGGALESPVRLLLAAFAFFLVNTALVATVIGLTEGKSVPHVWRSSYLWSFPNYLVGAAASWSVSAVSHSFGWQTSVLLLPVFYFVYRSHNLYVTRLDEAQKRAEEQRAHTEHIAALQRRTIETLAMAVEAKDQNTHDHLARVEIYAIEVGRSLGLSSVELEALRAAAILHDVGKIAVPEYIISKPGRLTPDEFEKMKTHTVVGAQIVEQIGFPYAVAPIVRAHHEKWDGSGYPDGLSGQQIPLSARILAAVDCMDALTSDRPYRRSLTLDEAMKVVQAEAGRSYDPEVVAVLARRQRELELLVKSGNGLETRLATDMKIERGAAPAAGFQSTSANLISLDQSIRASEGCQKLITRLRNGVNDRTLHFAALRQLLPDLIPYAAMAVYLRRGDHLQAAASDPEASFGGTEIRMGAGLTGWVAENGQAIINGNPSVEPASLSGRLPAALSSALAVPLETPNGIAGVLSLYREDHDAFSNEDLALLHSIGRELAHALEAAPAAVAHAGPLG